MLRGADETEAARRKIKSLEVELAHVKAAKKAKSKSPSSEAEPSGLRTLHDAALPADLHVPSKQSRRRLLGRKERRSLIHTKKHANIRRWSLRVMVTRQCATSSRS